MRIIVVGATGSIGQAACKELEQRHEVITVGRSGGDYQVNVGDIHTVKSLYEAVGDFDAEVSCAGDATFAPLAERTKRPSWLGFDKRSWDR